MALKGSDNSLDPGAVLANLPPVPGGVNGGGDPGSGVGGGIDMNPQEPPPEAPVLERSPAPPPPPQQPEQTMVVGQGREDGGQPAPQAQPVPVQQAQPAKPTEIPLAVYERLRDQWQADRDRARALEQRAQELEAYRQQSEPLLAAFKQEWPQIQGIKAEKARLEQEAQYERAAREYVAASYSRGEMPDLDGFARNWKQERLLQQAANLPQVIEQTVQQQLQAILDNRDQTYAQMQQQQAIQAEEARRAAAVQRFEQEYAEIELQVPQIAGVEGLKRAAFIDWAQSGGQKSVKDAASPYLRGFQTQQVAAQAAQMSRAEIHATMPTTLSGGSGASAPAQTNSLRPPIEVIRGGSRAIAQWHQQRLRQAAGR